MESKKEYAEAMGFELSDDEPWPRRCDNCRAWGMAPKDEPRKLEGTDVVMQPCRRAPPHVIWNYAHLIDTTDENFGLSQWPYTAAHWNCGGWKPNVPVVEVEGAPYKPDRIPALTLDTLDAVCNGRTTAKIELNRSLMSDVVQNMSAIIEPSLSRAEIAEGLVGRMSTKVPDYLATAEIRINEELPSQTLRGLAEDGTVLFMAFVGLTLEESLERLQARDRKPGD